MSPKRESHKPKGSIIYKEKPSLCPKIGRGQFLDTKANVRLLGRAGFAGCGLGKPEPAGTAVLKARGVGAKLALTCL